VSVCVAIGVSRVYGAEEKSSGDRIVHVGPNARIRGADSVRVSLEKRNTIRWVADEPVTIVFPVDNFPVLEDGTKVERPPLEGMRPNAQKTKWFPDDASNGGAVNPELAPLLARAKDGVLVYRYRIHLNTIWGYGSLIVQK
jgi:hypothetical protein